MFFFLSITIVSCGGENENQDNGWKKVEITNEWGEKTGKTIQRYTSIAQRYTTTDYNGYEYTMQIDCYKNRTEIKILDSYFIGFGPSGTIKVKYNNEVMECLVFHPDDSGNKMYLDGVPKNTHMSARAERSGFSVQQWNSILKTDDNGFTDLIQNSEEGIITVMMDKRDFEDSSSGTNKYKFTIKTLGKNFNKTKSNSQTIKKKQKKSTDNESSGDAPTEDAPEDEIQTQEKLEDNPIEDMQNKNTGIKLINDEFKGEDDCYIINVTAVKTQEEARSEVTNLKNKGLDAGFLWIPDFQSLSGAKYYSVFIGPFATQEECEKETEEYRKIQPNAYGLLVSQQNKRVEIRGKGKAKTIIK